jgi:glycosyltransferase involved in cell wall biosynthesis
MPMRVLVSITDQCWGGKQGHVWTLVQALREAHHDVVALAELQGAFAARCAEIGLAHVCMDAASWTDERAVRHACAAWGDAEDPHLVVATGHRDAEAIARAWPGPRAPARAMIRCSGFDLPQDVWTPQLVDRFDLIVATAEQQLSKQFRDVSRGGVLGGGRAIVYRTAVDTRHFAPRQPDPGLAEQLGLAEDAFVIGCVARLSWEKDHATLLRAVRELLDAGIEAKLVLVGDGDERDAIAAQIAQLGLRDVVHLLGARRDVAAALSVCSVGCLVSSCDETGPMALKEAMAMGLPVVASDVGGVGEFVLHGETGILVPPRDPGATAHALATLSADASLRARLGRHARTLMVREHDDARRRRVIAREFEELLVRRSGLAAFIAEMVLSPLVRFRREQFGGLLFTPDSSLLIELDPREAAAVEAAIDAGSLDPLLESPTQDVPIEDTLAWRLYCADAFKRPLRQHARPAS